MIDIPQNVNDDKKSRMDTFVEHVVNALKTEPYVKICDDSHCNAKGVPGISYSEARQLARMFCDKGYHAAAYYIDCPSHGFRHVIISTYVQSDSSARCSHTEVWG